MPPADRLLLDLLQPGEFLRFVFAPDGNGCLTVSLEGGGGTGGLSERVALSVGSLRAHGYVFERAGGTASRETPEIGPLRWIGVRPKVRPVRLTERGGLGFGGEEPNTGGANLRLPHFANEGGAAGAMPGDLFAACRELCAVEVEFLRCELGGHPAEVLRRFLDLRLGRSAAALPEAALGRRAAPSPEDSFAALWLLEGAGWEVTLRMGLRPGTATPSALLELAGLSLFGAACEVTSGENPDEPASGTEIDFSRSFPRGWPFPAMLPTGEETGALAALPLYNRHPPRLPREGLDIGIVEGRRVRLPGTTRDRHTYLVGATGTGKSILLERMIVGDLRRGEGVVVLDPHGDLHRRLLASVPPWRRGEILSLDPANPGEPPAFNIFDLPRDDRVARRRLATGIVDGLLGLFEELWDMQSAGGPMFELYFRNTVLLLSLQSEKGGHRPHLGHFVKVLTDEDFRKRLLLDCEDQDVVDFWTKTAERVKGDARLENIVPYITSKLSGLVQGGFVSGLLCRDRNELRLRERLDRGEILLVNLDKGILGSRESRLLGTLLMREIFAAGLSRSALPPEERTPVNVYVDEFQNFVSDNVASMLSEARKFGLRLHLANQTLAQLRANRGRENLLETVLGNVGNLIAFRLGVPDAEFLRAFLEPLAPSEMKELPNYHAFARLLSAEGPLRPFVFRTFGPRRMSREHAFSTPSRKKAPVAAKSPRRSSATEPPVATR